MSLTDLLNRLAFRTAGDGWPTGTDPNGNSIAESNVTNSGKAAIIDALKILYNSSTMSGIFEQFLKGSNAQIRFSEYNGTAFRGAVTFGDFSNNGWIDLDFSAISDIWWFNDKGTLVKVPYYLQLGHELLHYLKCGDDAGNNLRPTDKQISSSSWDFKGSVTNTLNIISAELGASNFVRTGYQPAGALTSAELSPFKAGHSYTDGHLIDLTVVSSNPADPNDIDLSHRSESILIFGLDGEDYLRLGSGNDYAYGGDKADIILGGAGNDHLYGEGGIDDLDGGSGDDYLDGGDEADTLRGGDGNDTLIGGAGEDIIYTGDGFDTADGGADADTVYGGKGYQVFSYESSKQALDAKIVETTIDNRPGIMLQDSQKGSDANGDKLFDIEAIRGSNFDDTLDGRDSFVDIRGGDGDDTLYGSMTVKVIDDQLRLVGVSGGDGNDTLIGGASASGGPGNDTIDMRGWLNPPSTNPYKIFASVYFSNGFGHDRILSDHDVALKALEDHSSTNSQDISTYKFFSMQKSNFDIIYNVSNYTGPAESGPNAVGDLAIVEISTGDSVLIKDFLAQVLTTSDGSYAVTDQRYFWSLNFSDGFLTEEDIHFGPTSQYESFWPA